MAGRQAGILRTMGLAKLGLAGAEERASEQASKQASSRAAAGKTDGHDRFVSLTGQDRTGQDRMGQDGTRWHPLWL